MPASSAKQKRVFIVDNDPTSRDSLRRDLQECNVEVIEAAGGYEALQYMADLTPDALLVSATLPEMAGYELCKQLKRSISYRHIPIILLMALDSAAERVQALEAGADELISRSATRLELQARVMTMLRVKMQYDELERLLELRQAFSYMIVHDLRNPLAAVMLYLQLLKRRNGVAPSEARYLDLALAESQKMGSFLDDMLMLVKMERGKLTLTRSALSMDSIISQVCEKFDPLAEAQGVTLVTHKPAQPYQVLADVTLLQRVIENLVANALKFAPPHSNVTIQVEYPQSIREGTTGVERTCQLRISVLDQGRGIPADDMVRMFDQYEAVHMKEHGKSELGLELAFCRMVAEAHNGRIYAANNPDCGAVITVEI